MGQSVSAPVPVLVNIDQLVNGCHGDDKFAAVWEELKVQQYLAFKHLKPLPKALLDLFSGLSPFTTEDMRSFLNIMLSSYTTYKEGSIHPNTADTLITEPFEGLFHCVEAILCYPEEDIIGPVGAEYRTTITSVGDKSATTIVADVDMQLNAQHIIQLTCSAKPESFSKLLHCVSVRYLAHGLTTQYITQVNITLGTIYCWEVKPSFYACARAQQFLEDSLSRYHQRLHHDHEYWG